ncbi:MAG: 23S rRNA (adenine(2503)-C(2))-methyltransferase RlmN [Brevinema sp.]
MSKRPLLEYSLDQIEKAFVAKSFPKYKATNVAAWLYKKSVFDFQSMTDLSKSERALLAEDYEICPLTVKHIQQSIDGTVKFLFEALDGVRIESVVIPSEDDARYTVCVSSQVGCALRCSFCATGKMGFTRNLSASEIVAQVLLTDAEMKKRTESTERAIDNIVFMGMGEPLLNYEAVMKAITNLNNPQLFDIGTRRITISTSGIIEGIQKLSSARGQIRLALSLHAANHEKRKNIMPIARTQNTGQVLDAIRKYQDETGRRITIEYILIEGFNDSEEDVLALKHSLYRIKYSMNVIPLNPVTDLPYEAPSANAIKMFQQRLRHHSIPFVMRTPKGMDIDAACGQLALKKQST